MKEKTVKKENNTTSAKYTDEDAACANYIFKGVQRLDKDKKLNIKSWANTVRLMREIDKRDHREICEVFKFANNDVRFWQRNVLSPESLRKNFVKLRLEMEGSKGKSANHHFDNHDYGQGGQI